jgi:hypothetical protein
MRKSKTIKYLAEAQRLLSSAAEQMLDRKCLQTLGRAFRSSSLLLKKRAETLKNLNFVASFQAVLPHICDPGFGSYLSDEC